MSNVIETFILGWIGDLEPSELRDLAAKKADVTVELFAEYGDDINAARMVVGRRAVQKVRDMTDGDFDALIVQIRRAHPEHGAILGNHKDWFVEQAKLARQRFLA